MRVCLSILVLAACGQAPNGGGLPAAYDPHSGDSVDAGQVPVVDAGAEPDAGLARDTGPVPVPDAGRPANCDADHDGFDARICGGSDCDDERRAVHPAATERCDFIDNNCDDEINEGLDCSFLAAGPRTLYAIDPFQGELEELATVELPSGRTLLDVDTDENGELVGVTRGGLYALSEDGASRPLVEARVPSYTNGMAINGFGTVFLTTNEFADPRALVIGRDDGSIRLLGNTSPFRSSGDCVVLKDESLLMSAQRQDSPLPGDWLVLINSSDGSTQPIGSIGFSRVFGLSASFDFLFGVTDGGEVIEIDANTGRGRLLFQADEGIRFWGAANAD